MLETTSQRDIEKLPRKVRRKKKKKNTVPDKGERLEVNRSFRGKETLVKRTR